MSESGLPLLLGAGLVGSLTLALMLTPIAMRVARRVGFVDRPGGHKSHRDPIPYAGGVAIFIAAWVPALLAAVVAQFAPIDALLSVLGEAARPYIDGLRDRAASFYWLLLGAAALHALGLIDDARPLGPRIKFSVMTIVAILVATLADVRIVGGMAAPWVSIALTVLWIVVIVNAFNFLDNMDGLSAGVATINLAFLAICGVLAGQAFVPALACVFCGAILGFLVFNFPPARIFMGDAGSLVVGYMVAIVSIMTTYYNAESGAARPPYALAMPLVALAVPLYDFVTVVGIRILEGRSPFHGDQRHFSHRLVDHGLSRRFAVLTIYLATAATGLAATLLPKADLRQTLTIVCLVLMVLGIIAILEMPPKPPAKAKS